MADNIIFVSDEFLCDSKGGGEQTTEALILSSRFHILKIRSKDLTQELIQNNKDCFWIFANYYEIKLDLIPDIVSSLSYVIIEYDMKFCAFRSPETHRNLTGQKCYCGISERGLYISTFLGFAKKVFWMSRLQMEKFYAHCPPLKKNNDYILSSAFSLNTLDEIYNLRQNSIKNDTWIVLGSSTWLKGKDQAISYCKKNNLKFEVVWGLEYSEMLKKLAISKGLIFLPNDSDTCPRIVIEAKLLDCELILNENVQHKNEEWFNTNDLSKIEDYLLRVPFNFWKEIEKIKLAMIKEVEDCQNTNHSMGSRI